MSKLIQKDFLIVLADYDFIGFIKYLQRPLKRSFNAGSLPVRSCFWSADMALHASGSRRPSQAAATSWQSCCLQKIGQGRRSSRSLMGACCFCRGWISLLAWSDLILSLANRLICQTATTLTKLLCTLILCLCHCAKCLLGLQSVSSMRPWTPSWQLVQMYFSRSIYFHYSLI